MWAVSGPNISPGVDCTPDGQCRDEEGGRQFLTAIVDLAAMAE